MALNVNNSVMAFDKQAAAPSVDSSKAQIYAKEVAGGPSAELLLHLDGNLTDSANGHTCTGTPSSYTTSGAGNATGADGTGFGNAAVITAVNVPNQHIVTPDLGLGTGDLTIEFWLKRNGSYTGTQDIVGIQDTSGPTGYTNMIYIQIFSNNSAVLVDHGSLLYYYGLTTAGGGDHLSKDTGAGAGTPWRHYAFTRTATSGGNSQWDFYFSGQKYTGTAIGGYNGGSPLGNWATADLSGYVCSFGGKWSSGTNWIRNYRGNIDEIAVFKTVEYTGSTYTVPTEPHGAGGAGATKLFVMDSAGNEVQIGD
jgi:hypothetical protein